MVIESKKGIIFEVIREVGRNKHGSLLVEIICPKCGEIFTTLASDVKAGKVNGCRPCYHKDVGRRCSADLLGQERNGLTVVKRLASTNQKARWLCRCECGETISLCTQSFRSRKKKGCGVCLQSDKVKRVGLSGGGIKVLRKSGRYKYVCETSSGDEVILTYAAVLKHVDIRSSVLHKLRAVPWEFFGKEDAPNVFIDMEMDHDLDRLVKEAEYVAGDFEIDHICPASQAITTAEVKQLQHYSNIRIVSAKENKDKRAFKTPEGEDLCRKLLGREWIDSPISIRGNNVRYRRRNKNA